MRAVQEPGELGRDTRLFARFQLEKHVFLAGEVEEERSMRHACGRHDRAHLGAGHTRDLELGDGRAEYAFPRLQSACFARSTA